MARPDVSDLMTDPLIRLQHRHYVPFAIMMAFVVPTVTCGLLWGDWAGGFFFAGCARLVCVHHSHACANSFAHFVGGQHFSDLNSSRDSLITSIFSLGEGNHNFHHEYPSDYRNGYRWYHYDPTKWFVWTMETIGCASRLNRVSEKQIQKSMVNMRHKTAQIEAAGVYWGPDPDTLPKYTADEVYRRVAETGAKWVVSHGYVLDMRDFMDDHPGGKKWIEDNLGRDVSEMFDGKVYRHSAAARNVAMSYRIGRVTGKHSQC